MRIRKLELQGFKSFVDRQTFHFGSGIAGVVGPNGCGKSNVVDAVKWVIGEQSAKSLRGGAMQDVIFSGSASRKRVGLAEVVVTFSSDGEPFPGDYARFEELQIGRRLYRDGTSEYLLAGVRVRRKDVVDLLMDTGVGNKLYSFIEQGQIGEIVQAKPEQRRGLLEEAAGISRFKARKAEAEHKLEATAANLERATDLAEEMGRRLRVLERQVEKAARHKRYSAQIRQGEIFLGLVQYNELLLDRRALGQRSGTESARARAFAKELEQREHELAGRKQEIGVLSRAVAQLRERLSELEATRRETESARHYQDKEARDLETRQQVLEHDLAEARKQAETGATESDRLKQDLADTQAALLDRSAALADLQQRADNEARELARVRAQVEDGKRKVMSLVTGLVRSRARVEANERRRQELGENLTQFLKDQARVQTDLGGVQESLAAAQGRVTAAQEERKAAQDAVTQAQAQASEHKALVDRLQREQRDADRLVTERERSLARTEARHQSLNELAASHAGVDGGVRQVLSRAQHEGVLAEHLDVPESLEVVLTQAMDGDLETVLFGSKTALLSAAAQAQSGGRAKLLLVPETPEGAGLVQEIGGSELGQRAMAALLGDTRVVDNLEQAMALPLGVQAVVRGGGLRLANGAVLVGKSGKGAGAALLKRRRELAALVERLELERAALADAKLAASSSREASKAASDRSRAGQAKIEAMRLVLRQAEGVVGEARLGVRDVERDIQARQDRQRALAKEEGRLRARIEGVDGELEKEAVTILRDESRQEEAEAALTQHQSELVTREATAAQAREVLVTTRGQAAGVRERAKVLESSYASATRQRDDAQRRQSRLEKEQAKSRDRLLSLQGDDRRLMRLLQEQGEEQAELRGKLQIEKEHLGKCRAGLSADEERLRGLRDKLAAAKTEASRLELKLQEVKLGIEALRERVEGRYNLRLAGLLDRLEQDAALVIEAGEGAQAQVPIPGVVLDQVADLRVTPENLEDPAAVKAWVAMLEKAKNALQRLGDVNLAALEEYTEVAERHKWLSDQQADLELSVDAIRRTIAKINKTCRERFRDAFDRVNAYFKEIYPRLVGGGQARLSLTNEEDLLETGVDIFVQPPGKRLQNLSLLSGGEKAMCAIGLLFALFKVKPSPFCLLDEVDAPLDEGNGARFNSVLQEMSSLTQFIVITHNKKTMEVVDTLYGVTMPEPGASRLVSVKVD